MNGFGDLSTEAVLNQTAQTPPAGSVFVKETGQVQQCNAELQLRQGEARDSRLARVLKDIANQVTAGIEIEADYPSKNFDGKMPILDTKVWMAEGEIMFKHYEKPMSSKDVLHAKSAQSMTCKRSVHVQEVLRRMLNTSPKLDWQEHGAPCVTEYMTRMMWAEYDDSFR